MDEGDNLYDEFGNYIGPELADSDSDDGASLPAAAAAAAAPAADDSDDGEYAFSAYDEEDEDAEAPASRAIVLHEDKKYYANAEEVYGASVQTLVEEEDAQPLSEPIVAPRRQATIAVADARAPVAAYTPQFLAGLCECPALVRNVAVVGALHHGKTSFVDVLVAASHERASAAARHGGRFTDTRVDEQQLCVSVKTAAATLALPASSGKHYAVCALDTPGHPNFMGEVAAALRLADGVVAVVDAVEGVNMHAERLLRAAARDGLPVVLVLNKMDRLITELRLPPADAYHKIRDTLETVNAILDSTPAPARLAPRRPHSTPSSSKQKQKQQQDGGGGDEKDRRRKNETGSRKALPRISPQRGNVLFASALHGWCFTLESFAAVYAEQAAAAAPQPSRGSALPWRRRSGGRRRLSAAELAQRLWGDVYYDAAAERFTTKAGAARRSFVEFVLEPLYKIYAVVLGEGEAAVEALCGELGVRVRRPELRLDAGDLLRVVLGRFLGHAGAFVDMVVRHLPTPARGARAKAVLAYAGPQDGRYGRALRACSAEGPLLVHVAKLLARPDDATRFDALGRVLSGTVARGQRVAVLGEDYCAGSDDDDDVALAEVARVCLPVGRYRTEVARACAGAVVLLEGVDAAVAKTATLCDQDEYLAARRSSSSSSSGGSSDERPHAMRALPVGAEAVCKVAIEPLRPAELPKMLEGLRAVNKSYVQCVTKKEESGEHTLLGTGELQLDCVLRDLREVYAGIEIKVSDPFVGFRETVAETSAIPCFASTPNKRNKLTMIAEPLDPALAADIERGAITLPEHDNTQEPLSLPPSPPAAAEARRRRRERALAALFLQKKYGWDELAATTLWAFGPEAQGPNALVDDTLPPDVDKGLLGDARRFVVQGFRWGVREGPLCEEPVRGVVFRLTGAVLAGEAAQRSGVQLIPTARRACYSAMLTAVPRLLEPVYRVEVQTPHACVAVLQRLVAMRRGQVLGERACAGTPLATVAVLMPVIESYGFETDLRMHTQGQAFCQQVFDRWAAVPGDPCDRAVVLRPLEPTPVHQLAREFMVKTRRRKGLADDVAPAKFFDDELRALYDPDALAAGNPLPPQ